MTAPLRLGMNRQDTLQRAYASYYTEKSEGLESLIARKVEDLRHYDVPAMENAVAICYWGRSGSLLLGSYLDWHDDVVMLAFSEGRFIYPFFEEYSFLSLREKLVAYPDFTAAQDEPLFGGEFSNVESDYYAAIGALFEVYGAWPAEFLTSRKTFFQFLHVVYNLTLGRRPTSPRPLMVYAQHTWSDVAAKRLIDDFPEGRFLHTIRDPITTADSWFDRVLRLQIARVQSVGRRYIDPDRAVIEDMIGSDRPHTGMELRTRAVRFEDLHLNLGDTMNQVADWLGLSHKASLYESTFNGRPYVVERNGSAWSGPRLEQAQRRSRNMFFMDRGMLFAMFHENFMAWDYPCPKIFAYAWVRRLTLMALWLIPLKMEIIAAWTVMRLHVFPSLRRGTGRWAAIRSLGMLFANRMALRRVVGVACRRRLAGETTLLQTLTVRRLDPQGPLRNALESSSTSL